MLSADLQKRPAQRHAKSNTERSHERRGILKACGIPVKEKGPIEDVLRAHSVPESRIRKLLNGRGRSAAPSAVAPSAVAPVAPSAVAPVAGPGKRAGADTRNKIRSRDAFEWTDELKYRLVSKTKAGLSARGLRAEQRKALQIVIEDDVMSEPPFDTATWETLRSRYYDFRGEYQNPPPTVALQQAAERWISCMGHWGASPERARERVNFLVDVAKQRLPADQVLPFIENRLFGHAEQTRWGDSTKLQWIERQIEKVADPSDFPRKRFRKRSKSALFV